MVALDSPGTIVPGSNYEPICDGLAAIEHGKVATLSFRFQGHRRSKVKVAFDPSHMVPISRP